MYNFKARPGRNFLVLKSFELLESHLSSRAFIRLLTKEILSRLLFILKFRRKVFRQDLYLCILYKAEVALKMKTILFFKVLGCIIQAMNENWWLRIIFLRYYLILEVLFIIFVDFYNSLNIWIRRRIGRTAYVWRNGSDERPAWNGGLHDFGIRAQEIWGQHFKAQSYKL